MGTGAEPKIAIAAMLAIFSIVADVALVVLGVIGTLLFYAVEAAERLARPWHVSQRNAAGGARPR